MEINDKIKTLFDEKEENNYSMNKIELKELKFNNDVEGAKFTENKIEIKENLLCDLDTSNNGLIIPNLNNLKLKKIETPKLESKRKEKPKQKTKDVTQNNIMTTAVPNVKIKSKNNKILKNINNIKIIEDENQKIIANDENIKNDEKNNDKKKIVKFRSIQSIKLENKINLSLCEVKLDKVDNSKSLEKKDNKNIGSSDRLIEIEEKNFNFQRNKKRKSFN